MIILLEVRKRRMYMVCEHAPLALDLARLELFQTDEASPFQLALMNDMVGL